MVLLNLEMNTTVFQAEVIIHYWARQILGQNFKDQTIVIYSDSQAGGSVIS